MYGTVARLRVKPGNEQKLIDLMKDLRPIPGMVDGRVYKMDADPNEFYLVVAFQDKDAYFKNADSPEQDADYQKMRALLESDPEWHDGEVVFTQ
jgi:quinol monooxygenase YgiN